MLSTASSVIDRPQTVGRSAIAPASVEKLVKSQKSSLLKRAGSSYWRKLISAGIPHAEARELAIALIRFNYLHKRPNSYQRRLMRRYCQRMGTVGLWKLELMLGH